MPHRRGIAAALLAGLALGVAGGWLVWGRTPDRVEVALALLEQRCAPQVLKGTTFDARGLVAVAKAPRGRLWVEPRSRIALDSSDKTCGLTDALAPFDDAERTRFVAGAEVLGLRLMPGAAAATPEGGRGWAVFRMVSVGTPASSDAVLTISRFAAGEDAWVAHTTATLRRLREDVGG